MDYLKQVHPACYHALALICKLWTYLADMDEQAWERPDGIMEQMKAAEGVTGELTEKNNMG